MASGDTLVHINALNHEPGASPLPTFDVRNNIPILDFDAGGNEKARFGCFMPRHYNGGGITVTIGWMASTATSGNVKWNMQLLSVTDDADDLDSKVYAATQTVTAGAADVSGEVDYTTISFTDGAQMDSIAAGEYFRLTLERQGAHADDTMVGDAEMLFIEIKEA